MNDGSQGGREAIAFLRSLGDMLDQGAEDTRVTVKWDGVLQSSVVSIHKRVTSLSVRSLCSTK